MAATENQVAEEVIYQLLTNNLTTDTEVYKYLKPTDKPLPCIVINPQAPGRDVSEVGSERIMCDILYQIVVHGELSDLDNVDAIAAEMDAILHKAAAEPNSQTGYVYAIVRQSSLSYPALIDGKTYITRGGTYRVLVQASR